MRSASVDLPNRRSPIELGNALPCRMHRHDHSRALAHRASAHRARGSHSERARRASPDPGRDIANRSRGRLRPRTECLAGDGAFQRCRSTAADCHGGHQHGTQRGSRSDGRRRSEARASVRRPTCVAAGRPLTGRLHHRRRPRRSGRDGGRRVSRFAERFERTWGLNCDHRSRHSKRADRSDWRAGRLLSFRRSRAGARGARRSGSPRCRPCRRPGLSSSPDALGSDGEDPSQLVRPSVAGDPAALAAHLAAQAMAPSERSR